MTLTQQLAAADLEDSHVNKRGQEVMTFNDEREYLAWATAKGKA